MSYYWYGNQQIGILGLNKSGKTMLLTSLLWHLSDHNQERFLLKYGKVSNFELRSRDEHDFNFKKYKCELVMGHRWPEKTIDYAIADFKYECDRRFKRHLRFVDIPGERVSDIPIWTASNYRSWAKVVFKSWDDNPKLREVMKNYRELANKKESTIGELAKAYKRAMWTIIDNYSQITPSTYFLGTDGSQLDKQMDREAAIKNRPIWSGGELLPLSESWGEAHRKEFKKMEKTFKNYKHEVLKPLFKEIDRCDNYIFCVDFPSILNRGPAFLNDTRNTFDDFITHFAPNRLQRFYHHVISHNPGVAYVATKSDMFSDPNNLKSLLIKYFPINFKGFDVQYYTCSACVSCDKVNREDIPHELPLSWEPGVYFRENAPRVEVAGESIADPPRQKNLDKILDFVVEGVNYE